LIKHKEKKGEKNITSLSEKKKHDNKAKKREEEGKKL
jgi:hypothetical protein